MAHLLLLESSAHDITTTPDHQCRTALVGGLGTRLGNRPSEVCRSVESLRGRVTPHAAHAPSVGRGCAPRRRSGQSICCRGRPLSRETTRAPGNVAPPACVTACDHVLRDGVPHCDLDPEHFAPRARLRILVAKSTRGMPHSGPLEAPLAVGTACAIPFFVLREKRVEPRLHTARVITSSPSPG